MRPDAPAFLNILLEELVEKRLLAKVVKILRVIFRVVPWVVEDADAFSKSVVGVFNGDLP